MASDGDILFDIRNTYYLGAYQQCIVHAQVIFMFYLQQVLVKREQTSLGFGV